MHKTQIKCVERGREAKLRALYFRGSVLYIKRRKHQDCSQFEKWLLLKIAKNNKEGETISKAPVPIFF